MTLFATLWKHHPHVTGEESLLDRKVYENQCAVNLSASLMRSGISMKSFAGAWSWQKDKPKYALRAQELADWLASGAAHLPSRTERIAGNEVFGDVKGKRGIAGRSGIIFFRNYWGTGNQGDHIDLWNGSRLSDTMSWLRIHARVGGAGLGTDYRRSESCLFWQVQ